MKLYDCTPAPSPRRVRVFLAEKGVEIPLVQVDLMAQEQLSESFRRLNPLCEVPALELDDGGVITECSAICRYLEELYPEPPLFGRNARERAEIAMWDHRMEIEGFLGVAEVFRNKAKGFAGRALSGPGRFEQIPELVKRGEQRVARFHRLLDDRLAHSSHVAGADFSVADITAVICIDFATRAGLGIPEGHDHLKAWHDRVSARPSMKA